MNIRTAIGDLLFPNWNGYRFWTRSDGLFDLEVKQDFNRAYFDNPENLSRLSKVAHIKGDWNVGLDDQLDQLRVVSGNLSVGRITRQGRMTVGTVAPELQRVLGHLHVRGGRSFLNAPNLYWVAGDIQHASMHPDALQLPSLLGIGGHLCHFGNGAEHGGRSFLPSLVALGGEIGGEFRTPVVQDRLGPLGALTVVEHYRNATEAARAVAMRIQAPDASSSGLDL